MDISEFDYDLPPDRIAQVPVDTRDASRLLAVNRNTGSIVEYAFRDIPRLLSAGDVLVINDSWVMPARIYGEKIGGGAKIEVLLLEDLGEGRWKVIAQRASRLNVGVQVQFPEGVVASIEHVLGDGLFEVTFSGTVSWDEFLDKYGKIPLPPYIRRDDGSFDTLDRERYQTVYAHPSSKLQSAAAPTAGLHFTDDLLRTLKEQGIIIASVTLRVGLDTFLPIRSDRVENHPMHSESYRIAEETAETINIARARGGRIIAVGTTAVRVLESSADSKGRISPGYRETSLFITPGYTFKAIDGMVTNFHLPRSTLVVMIASWLGQDKWRTVYDEAIQRGFRFYSYGDAMLAM